MADGIEIIPKIVTVPVEISGEEWFNSTKFYQSMYLDCHDKSLDTKSSNLVPLLFLATVFALMSIKYLPKWILGTILFCWNRNPQLVQASLLFPFRVPFIDGFYNLFKFRRDGVKALEEMAAKFGYFYEVNIGPITTVVIADAALAQKVLCSPEPTHMNKPQAIYSRIFIEWFKDGLVNSEYPVWSSHRKMLSRSFTYKSLQHYLKIMNNHAQHLIKTLKLASPTSGDNSDTDLPSAKIYDAIYCHAMKMIHEILMGVGRFSEETLKEFTYNFHALLNPLLQFQPYWYFYPNRKEYNHLNLYLTSFLAQTTQSYREEYEQKKIYHNDDDDDVSNVNIASDVGERPFRCVIEEMLYCDATDKEIYDEVGTLLATGHETTVVAIQMLLLHLAHNPEHQNLCREEVDNFFRNKGCETYSGTVEDCDITMDDVANLKYLERCILESGRITSTIPIFIRRLDTSLKIDTDLTFPAGTNVAFLPWVLHKNPKYFPNPEKFDPDRFLPENVKKRHPYAYIAFSGGQRNCIGWKMAIMEMKVIMTWILRHFEIFSKDKVDDVKLLFEVTLSPERNYNIIFRRRNKEN